MGFDFFTEFERLKLKTPRTSGVRLNNINSDYTHNTDRLKNCYLIANAVGSQDCMYGRDVYENTDCVDCDHVFRCTLCYECVNCKDCYDCSSLQDSNNCLNCDYGYDLKDCKNCIGCAGLRKKEFHIFNKLYSKEEFLAKKKTLTPAEIRKKFEEVKLKTPRLYSLQIDAEHCFGDDIYHSKNVFLGFDISECEDCFYIYESRSLKDCYDIFVLEWSELCYDISSCHKLTNCNFCFHCMSSNNLEYCEWLNASHDCFGCVSRNHAEYEILNEKYSKDEYFKKVVEIKEQMKKDGTYGRKYLESTYPLEDTVSVWQRW